MLNLPVSITNYSTNKGHETVLVMVIASLSEMYLAIGRMSQIAGLKRVAFRCQFQ